ncbi:MAG: efflux RND transporter periplasmic adaptor subunit [Chroococcidiopsidaceae cyanobacterium CP_BM_RX_35]|nr:efflux RND transporter periplasmic adaptor subunit [Chroococcidiopsidaceae cyanobacterium CP_BM_RX_35]
MDSSHRPSPDPANVDSQRSPSPEPSHQPVKRSRGIGRRGWIVIGAVAATSLLALGILPRLNRQQELARAVKVQSAAPTVNVIHAKYAPADTDLALPGSVVALNQTTIYARADGYLQRWLVDIGDRVHSGQLLAVVESPDIDQEAAQAGAQLAQSQASLVQSRASLAKGLSDLKLARANQVLAYKTWQRYKFLVGQGVVSQQDADTQLASYRTNTANVQSAQNTVNSDQANISVAMANVNASRANLQRYSVLQSFEKVTAPFDGVITARNVNRGALITSGSGNSSNTSLYTITSYSSLEVNVNVPQNLASSIQSGQAAQIQIREIPQRSFTGKVIRTTNALDPSSRTLLTQVEVPNPEGLIRPGMYANAKFTIARAYPPLMLPDSALVVNAGGTQVATITQAQTIHYHPIQVGRDYGTQIEVTSGLNTNESILANPRVDLVEGTKVRTVAPRNN